RTAALARQPARAPGPPAGRARRELCRTWRRGRRGYAESAAGKLSPARGDDLLARVELDRVVAVRVQVAVDRVLPAREREPRHGGCDAHVHADHPGLDAEAVTPRCLAGGREDRAGVAVARAVHELERLVEVAGPHDGEQRSEELLACDLGVAVAHLHDRRAEQRAGLVAGVAAVEDELRALAERAIDGARDPVARFGADQRTDLDALLVAG